MGKRYNKSYHFILLLKKDQEYVIKKLIEAKKNMNKRVLITGAGGYIGTLLVPLLLKNKFKVVALDRFYFGKTTLTKLK